MDYEAKNSAQPRDRLSIFDFSSYTDYLKAAGLPQGHYSHQSNNLKKWARRLGYRSASSITMILSGQRLPSAELIQALAQDLEMTPAEKDYFETLVQLEKINRKGKDPVRCLEKLKSFDSQKSSSRLSLSEFQLVADWYFVAIKNLMGSPHFQEDPEWIRKRLRGKVTAAQVTYALRVLEECGAAHRDDDGRLQLVETPWRTPNGVSSAAIRRHHFGMIQRAQEALDEQAVEDRYMSGLTCRIDVERMAEARAVVADFMESFNREFHSSGEDEVYQLNLQLFALTNLNGNKGASS